MSDHSSWPLSALEDSVWQPLWLDTAARPAARPALTGEVVADLLVVGGGFTGLWTALRAVERHPGLRVVLIEADRLAEHATGRNGGFCEASLTHGELNGSAAGPTTTTSCTGSGSPTSTRSRRASRATTSTAGSSVAAPSPWRPGPTRSTASSLTCPDSSTRTQCAPWSTHPPTSRVASSPTSPPSSTPPGWRGAWRPPPKAQGVQVAEGSRLVSLRRRGSGMEARTPQGVVHADRVVLATNVFPGPLRRTRWSIVPVYDYVLATEPLSQHQLDSLGWDPGLGVADSGNQFHYYRITPDRRILWGGYDAIYHYGRSIAPQHDDRPATFETLARNFAATFPQLDGIRFTHRWSGVIDTSTRFCAFFGLAHRRRTAYATGFTGLASVRPVSQPT